jgi:hypothetical protein
MPRRCLNFTVCRGVTGRKPPNNVCHVCRPFSCRGLNRKAQLSPNKAATLQNVVRRMRGLGMDVENQWMCKKEGVRLPKTRISRKGNMPLASAVAECTPIQKRSSAVERTRSPVRQLRSDPVRQLRTDPDTTEELYVPIDCKKLLLDALWSSLPSHAHTSFLGADAFTTHQEAISYLGRMPAIPPSSRLGNATLSLLTGPPLTCMVFVALLSIGFTLAVKEDKDLLLDLLCEFDVDVREVRAMEWRLYCHSFGQPCWM